jgi:hypothetical protein
VGWNLYVAADDATLADLLDVPAPVLDAVRACETAHCAATATCNVHTPAGQQRFDELEARFDADLLAIHPKAPAVAGFLDRGFGRMVASAAWLYEFAIDIHEQTTARPDVMIAMLERQRDRAQNALRFGGDDAAWAAYDRAQAALLDRAIALVRAGRITKLCWY